MADRVARFEFCWNTFGINWKKFWGPTKPKNLEHKLVEVFGSFGNSKSLLNSVDNSEGPIELENEIDKLDDDIRQGKSEAFLQYRQEGTDANPGNLDELVDDAEYRILDIDQRINRIMNPLAIPIPLPPQLIFNFRRQSQLFYWTTISLTQR